MIEENVPGAAALARFMRIPDEEVERSAWREYVEAVKEAASGAGNWTAAERAKATEILEREDLDADSPPSKDEDDDWE